MNKIKQSSPEFFWKSFIILGFLLVLYSFLTFSEFYLTILFSYILGSLIGLSVALITFSNKKAMVTSEILFILAVLYSIFVFFSVSGFFLTIRMIFTRAIGVWIVFSIIFWVYKKVNKNMIWFENKKRNKKLNSLE